MKKKIFSQIFSFFRKFFPFFAGGVDTADKHSFANISANSKFEMVLMGYSGARGTLIYEKNLISKISCQTPFKLSAFEFWTFWHGEFFCVLELNGTLERRLVMYTFISSTRERRLVMYTFISSALEHRLVMYPFISWALERRLFAGPIGLLLERRLVM